MDLQIRTAPEDGDRHRRARARLRAGLWERWRPVLGWMLVALFAALVVSGMVHVSRAAASLNTGSWLSNGPAWRR